MPDIIYVVRDKHYNFTNFNGEPVEHFMDATFWHSKELALIAARNREGHVVHRFEYMTTPVCQ